MRVYVEMNNCFTVWYSAKFLRQQKDLEKDYKFVCGAHADLELVDSGDDHDFQDKHLKIIYHD